MAQQPPEQQQQLYNNNEKNTVNPDGHFVVDVSPPGRSAASRLCQIVNDSWALEIVALIFSIACLVALIVVLAVYQDKPLPEWSNRFSLNTVVSLLMIFTRGALMFAVAACIGQLKWNHYRRRRRRLLDFELFDEASRGPVGALRILASIPLNVVSIGALVTIVALAIGPFSQQLTRYNTRDVWRDDQRASFGIAHDYKTGITPSNGDGPVASTMDWKMQGTVIDGMYDQPRNPKFNCPSSSCNWNGSYITLGFGTSCADVTAPTLRSKRCSMDESNLNCNMTTPGNVTFHTKWEPTEYMVTRMISSTLHMPFVDTSSWAVGTNPPHNASPDFMSVAEYQLKDPPNDVGTDPPADSQLAIAECMFSLTAYNFSDVSAGGSNKFTVGSQPKIPLPLGQAQGQWSGQYLQDLQNYTFSKDNTHMPTFTVKVLDWTAIAMFLRQQLSNITTAIGADSLPDLNVSAALTAPSSGNVSQWMDRIAQRMTDTLRSNENMLPITGRASQSVIFVRVIWAWLVLPIVTVIGAILVLIFTIWQNSGRKRAILLKSSALAPLLCHLEKEDEAAADDEGDGSSGTNMVLVPGVKSQEDLEALAESKRVRLA